MPVTIRDVAKRLNLSITTVSRALDGYTDVAEATRKLVVREALEMGYVPNRAARQLRRKRTDTLGYILPAGSPSFADPFYSEFISGLGDEAALQNFDLLVSTAPPGEAAEKEVYQRWAQSRKVDGFLLNRARLYDWRVQFLAGQKIPFVALECSLDEADYPTVEVDGKSGFIALVKHLTGLGHRHIAYVGASPELKIQADRFEGFRQGLEAAGIALESSLILEGNLTQQGGYEAALRLLSQPHPPTAVTCINDLTAIGVMHAAHERGFTVGGNLAVAGFDGIEASAHTTPPLTTLNQPVYAIARQLVSMLMDLISGRLREVSRVTLLPELILRPSTTGFQL